jgi:hypothetical protein
MLLMRTLRYVPVSLALLFVGTINAQQVCKGHFGIESVSIYRLRTTPDGGCHN